MAPRSPIIGVTADVIIADNARPKAGQAFTYLDAITAAGGIPILLPPIAAHAARHAQVCDAFVFTGGEDIDMALRGGANHPAARTMPARRQEYEFALLAALDQARARPVLGICLGMQMMAVHRGGALDQHLPDTLPSAARHRGDSVHGVTVRERGVHAALRDGPVTSNHHQAVIDAGPMRILAHSEDGVIEAIDDPTRPFYLGVQWHPERTKDADMGANIFRALVAAASAQSARSTVGGA